MKHFIIAVLVSMFVVTTSAAQAFVDNGDNTVSDETTGLMWTKSSVATEDWGEACYTCSALPTGGYSDWRIPEIQELVTLVDHESGSIDPVFTVRGSNFWSGTEYGRYDAWSFNKTGVVVKAQKNDYSRYAFCVRGNKPETSDPFIVVADGLVADERNSLLWQQADDGIERTFLESVSYCNSLVDNDRDDWRMPTVEELSTLVLYRDGNNLKIYDDTFDTNSQFENQHFNFWTGTTYQSGNYAYRISFQDGTVTRTDKINQYFTRCVCEEEEEVVEEEVVEEEPFDIAALIAESGLTLDGTGSVHAYPNTISARTLKVARHAKKNVELTVKFEGYVVDKLATLVYGEGVVEAYIMLDDERIDIEPDDTGGYSVTHNLTGSKHLRNWYGKQWSVELYSVDPEGTTALVDSTYIIVEDWKHKPWKKVKKNHKCKKHHKHSDNNKKHHKHNSCNR